MGLEDFERSLVAQKRTIKRKTEGEQSGRKRERSRDRDRNRSSHDEDQNRSASHKKQQASSRQGHHYESSSRRFKRPRNSEREGDHDREHGRRHQKDKMNKDGDDEDGDESRQETKLPARDDNLDNLLDQSDKNVKNIKSHVEREAWMQAPSSLEIAYVAGTIEKDRSHYVPATQDCEYRAPGDGHELSQQLEDGGRQATRSHVREVDYEFGDQGSSWRMTKLKNIYRQAKEAGRSPEDVAEDKYGNLEEFDNAREEEMELDRRARYGSSYNLKHKPTGQFYQDRQQKTRQAQKTLGENQAEYDDDEAQTGHISAVLDTCANEETAVLDQTALNRLKAQVIKARLRGAANAGRLEEEYEKAVAHASRKPANIIRLHPMENRMLAGCRQGQVKAVEGKRGRDRGLVEENDDMTIADMVRQERRDKGRRQDMVMAERIVKDVKFTNDLDYLDENAAKLAKSVVKSDVSLRNMAVGDFQKLNSILDTCPLCHHQDKGTGPTAPVIALGTRVYLTLPTEPEVGSGGACIVPIQHHSNLLTCDEDEWEEMRNFMKCLMRMYHAQSRSVVFYENAAMLQRHQHTVMQAVPLPQHIGATAPAFFREAFLSSDEEWSQHVKVIDTLAKAKNGLGRAAFRKSLVKEMPYFHVWFELDGGLGHVIEDQQRWPKGDLFAREVLAGMLRVDGNIARRQGRWHKSDGRVAGFIKQWHQFDWTTILLQP